MQRHAYLRMVNANPQIVKELENIWKDIINKFTNPIKLNRDEENIKTTKTDK